MGFGRESNYGVLGFKTARGSRVAARFFFFFTPLIQYRTSSRSSTETSFNGTDFERTNRFPSQYHFSPNRAFMRRYARSREYIRTFAGGAFSALGTAEADSGHSPIRYPAPSLRPLDCIDHRWRGCSVHHVENGWFTRAHRIVTSMASSRSR